MREQINFFDKLSMRPEKDEPVFDKDQHEDPTPENTESLIIDFPKQHETRAARLAREAKEKDIALSTKKKLEDREIDIYVNRIQFFKDHIKNKSVNPMTYDNLDVNFEELLKAYESESPRDYFYMSVFGKSFQQKMWEEEAELEDEKLANI